MCKVYHSLKEFYYVQSRGFGPDDDLGAYGKIIAEEERHVIGRHLSQCNHSDCNSRRQDWIQGPMGRYLSPEFHDEDLQV